LSERCEGEDLSRGGVQINYLTITLGSIGQILVALKDFKIELSLKEDIQACRKRGKKYPLVIEARP
jgi:hypothetical protein